VPYSTFKEYRKAWNGAYENTPPHPLNIDIELASICNLYCPFCFITDEKYNNMIRQTGFDGIPRRRFMPIHLAKRLIDESSEVGVPALKFNWRGESTIHPQFSEILRYASGRNFHDILINTNGNFNYNAIAGVMETTKVMISLDSMRPETYKKMRVGGNLDIAKKNINELLIKGHKNVWVRRVLTKDNFHENFYEDVKKEWGDKVKASEHYVFDRNHLEQHESAGAEHYVSNGRQYCGYPSQRIVIASSGLAYPCCIDTYEEMPIGDYNRQTILEIWHGEKMKKLRCELKKNHFASPICKKCTSYMAYKTFQRRSVHDKELKK